MKLKFAIRGAALLASVAALGAPAAALAQASGGTVYRCPGNPVLYTDQLSPKEAEAKGCRTIEGAPITVMQMPRPRAPAAAAAGSDANRVSSTDQRARDDERRSILEAELRSSQQKLADLKKEYNNGEPERRGDERNYAKYQDRVAALKADITRKENDVAAIQREISKLPQ